MKFLFGDMIVEAVQTFKPIAAQVDMKLGGYYIWSSSSDEPHIMIEDSLKTVDSMKTFKTISAKSP